uniref:Uncharacterized protein n=1 Tax=Paramoeba aestuarina TaxID=180227 RepID=A0A7S4JX44_9EUKA|mmetsp:Transcript_13772/g.21387  ORF Transcript_13772/g.21387 Transcript_13772/m.21387 type:complete len:326 (+) Transcript_13772:151-1128(+)
MADPDEPLPCEISFVRMKMEDAPEVALFESYSFKKRQKMDIGIQEQWDMDDYISRFAMELAGEDPVCFGFLAQTKLNFDGEQNMGGGECTLCGFLAADVSFDGVWIKKVVAEGPQEAKIVQKLFNMAVDHWSFRYKSYPLRVEISPNKESVVSNLEGYGFCLSKASELENDSVILCLQRDNYTGAKPIKMTKELDESLNQRFAELSAKQRGQQQVWLPDVEGSGELLSPSQASNLQFLGIQVVVEMSRQAKRFYQDEEYAVAGCSLHPSGSWQNAPNNAAILMPQDVLESLRTIASVSSSEEEGISGPNMDKNFVTSLAKLGIED